MTDIPKALSARGVTTDDFAQRWNKEFLPVLLALRTAANVASGVITPVEITSDQNDYAPIGFTTASFIRLSSDASRTITGFDARAFAVPGQLKRVINIGSNDIVLAHEGTGSAAANRIAIPGRADLTLQPNDSALLWYDVVSDRARVL